MIEYTVKVYDDGTKKWYFNDKIHRENGPAWEDADGTKKWYLNGKLHREDGPAWEDANGDKGWFLNGYHHRVNGPAVEYGGGEKAWWLNGIRYTEEEYNRKMNPVKELSVAEFSKLLGYDVKVVK